MLKNIAYRFGIIVFYSASSTLGFMLGLCASVDIIERHDRRRKKNEETKDI